MPGQEPPLLETEQLVPGGLGEGAVRRVDELLVADPAVKRRAAVAQDLAVDFGTELLGAKEDDVEMPTPSSDVDQRVAQPALTSRRCVLVQLVDEHHDRIDAQLLPLGHAPDLLDQPGHEHFLHVGIAVGDVDDPQLLIAEGIIGLRQVPVLDHAARKQPAELVGQALECGCAPWRS